MLLAGAVALVGTVVVVPVPAAKVSLTTMSPPVGALRLRLPVPLRTGAGDLPTGLPAPTLVTILEVPANTWVLAMAPLRTVKNWLI